MSLVTHQRKSYANADIKHIVLNLWTGRMSADAPAYIGSVLTVGAAPGLVPDHVRHRHTHINETEPNPTQMNHAVDWVMNQFHSDRAVLVRSEDGTHRPATVVALALMRLGAHAADAVRCLSDAECQPLPLPFLELLAAEEARTYG